MVHNTANDNSEALPGVAYPGFRDNRSTLNTKTGKKICGLKTILGNFLDTTRSRTCLHIYLRPYMTMTFDKVESFMFLPHKLCVPNRIEISSFLFSECCVHKFGNRQTNGQTDEQTDNLRTLQSSHRGTKCTNELHNKLS